MNPSRNSIPSVANVGILLGLAVMAGKSPAATQAGDSNSVEKVSRPGVYRGYSREIYPSIIQTSRYVEGHDGTRLALEINHPSADGTNAVTAPLPVILISTRYGRGGALKNEGYMHLIK